MCHDVNKQTCTCSLSVRENSFLTGEIYIIESANHLVSELVEPQPFTEFGCHYAGKTQSQIFQIVELPE